MNRQISKKQTIGNILLILSLTASAVSGMYLHLVSEGFENIPDNSTSGSWQSLDMLLSTITHVACSVLALIAVSIHVFHNREWYKGLFRKNATARKHHNKGTIILSVIFLAVTVTGFAYLADGYPNSVLGMIHGKLGLLMILCVIVHIAKHRRHKFVSVRHLEGTPHVNTSRCVGCGICAANCPKNVFEMRQTATAENNGIVGRFKHRHRNGGKSYVVNPDACIRCGRCVRGCPKGAIKFMD